jgi:hypothetical protein
LSWSPLLTEAGTTTVNDGTARLNEALDTGDSGCADLAERPCESKRGAAIADNHRGNQLIVRRAGRRHIRDSACLIERRSEANQDLAMVA